jgi:23S rRNA pseudoU1915 N3-methylase RlmH
MDGALGLDNSVESCQAQAIGLSGITFAHHQLLLKHMLG